MIRIELQFPIVMRLLVYAGIPVLLLGSVVLAWGELLLLPGFRMLDSQAKLFRILASVSRCFLHIRSTSGDPGATRPDHYLRVYGGWDLYPRASPSRDRRPVAGDSVRYLSTTREPTHSPLAAA
jgi:hypothetical protein